ncbi:MAG TPA: HNH endonuclease [Candidatus Aquilonibacter sp.]|nr:HNH endonuclease [Candidatus Aquilonibacter sp.]
MPDIKFNCNECGQSLEVEASGAGSAVLCPTCNNSLIVPSVSALQKISPSSISDSDNTLEIPLNPLTLLDLTLDKKFVYIGQDRIKARVEAAIKNSNEEKHLIPHLLLTGQPGSGKTTLAFLMAGMMSKSTGRKIKAAEGRAIQKAGDLVGFLTKLEEGEILIIDNIDQLQKSIRDYLETAIVDFKLDVVLDFKTIRLNLPSFTLVATATKKDRLSSIILASFPMVEGLETLSAEGLIKIMRGFAEEFGFEVDDAAAERIRLSTNNTPKEILNRIRFVRVYAQTKTATKTITDDIALEALKMLESKDQFGDSKQGRQGISSDVRREVWRRDEGKCVICGSKENLEYDHIIPLSKGGSNTARNIELLCERHNRAKSDLIQ